MEPKRPPNVRGKISSTPPDIDKTPCAQAGSTTETLALSNMRLSQYFIT
jgi:hypothetical protein